MKLSIIIPTYNRSEKLEKCLDLLLKQSLPTSKYEILVIDDGSTDNTRERVTLRAKNISDTLRYLRQDNKGPAAARNMGIKNASDEIVLFIGDDIIASTDLLKEHYDWHKRYPQENIAILGYVTWAPTIKKTPLMRWLEVSGEQFGYPLIKDPDNVPYTFFYTANISLKREFLIKNGLFDEAFPYAAWEDIELAYRLQKKGLRIVFNKDASAYHEHYTDKKTVKRRAEISGRAKAIFHKKHPELKKEFEIADAFALRSIVKMLIWNLPSFCYNFIPEPYLYKSFEYIIYRLKQKGYQEWQKRL